MIKVKLKNHFTGANIRSNDPILIFTIEFSDESIENAKLNIPKITSEFVNLNLSNYQPIDSVSDIGNFFIHFINSIFRKKNIDLFSQYEIINAKTLDLAIGYYNERATLNVLELCIKLISDFGNLSKEKINNYFSSMEKNITKLIPDFQIQFLIKYAKKNNIPFDRPFENNNELPFWQFGWGNRSNIFFESSFMDDSFIGRNWSQNKLVSKRIFEMLGLPTPSCGTISTNAQIDETIKRVGYPCVVKPLNNARANGVLTNLNSKEELINAIEYAKKFTTREILIEKFIEGDVHRIMVIRGRFWCAIKREAAFVIADGKASLEKLIQNYNRKLEQFGEKYNIISKISFDEDLNKQLKIQSIDITDIPPKGKKVRLKSIPLISTGAVYSDVTKKINKEIVLSCEALAKSFGIQSCGIDFMTKDISDSLADDGYFIEINATPGLRVPLFAGIEEDVIGKIIIGENIDSIPINLIVCDFNSHEKIFKKISLNDNLGWISGKKSGVGLMEFKNIQNSTINKMFKKIIRNKTCNSIVAICDYRDLIKEGLPFLTISNTWLVKDELCTEDWCNVVRTHSENYKEIICIEDIPNDFISFGNKVPS